MDNLDNRVRYTKAVLQQALQKIMQKKNIECISVKELCEEAKVNRGTFYLHYSTPNDILMEIEQQFIDESMGHFSPYFNETSQIIHLSGLFGGILRNKELCRVIMGPNGSPRFVERLREMVRDQVVDGWCAEFPKYRREDLDYVFDYVFAGSMRLILSWIDDDKQITSQQLANRLDRLGHYSHLAISEFCK